MLPYDEGEEHEILGSRDMYELREIFGSDDIVAGVSEWLGDNWVPNEGGFDASQIMDMIYEIDNFQQWEDEDGVMHYSFDFEWESPDGMYSGTGHASG